MATFVLCNDWLDYMVEDADLASDQFRLALSNTAPASETSNPTADGNGILANVTQVAYTNITEDRTITTTSSSQTSGTYSLVLADTTLNATGTVAQFRYVYVYDDTVANDPLVCVYDNGSAVDLSSGESFTVNFGATLFTIS